MAHYDIAIVGAGPAGATLARLVGDNYRILLVDKRRSSSLTQNASPSRKCCGGLLAPDAQKMLSRLGLGLPKSVLVEPQLFVVRAMDIPQCLERYYQRYYINMDRQKFDRWLLSMVPSKVDIRLDFRLISYDSEKDHFNLTFIQNNKAYKEQAKIVVGADGAFSKVRIQSHQAHHAPKMHVAIQEWVETKSALPYFSAIFDPEITDYYCWTIPKEDCLIIGAALNLKNEPLKKFELFKNKLRGNGFQFGRTVCREGAFILRPQNIQQLSTGKKGIALLGEAGGWISPSSAEGLSYAFRSALILAEVLRSGPEDFEGHYYKKTREMRRNIFLKNVKSCFIFSPLLRKIVMKAGLKSTNIIQDEQIRKAAL